jgi:DnaD/phage-associated family protein
MRQIEKEGYAWARMGVVTQAEAVAYLKKYADRQRDLPQYMAALQLPDRPAAPSEEKYIVAWQEMGFGPEVVALAYDKTILRCRELKWPYLNGILKKWHEAGLHTVEEVQAGDRRDNRPAGQPDGRQEDLSWMKKYIDQRNRHGEA